MGKQGDDRAVRPLTRILSQDALCGTCCTSKGISTRRTKLKLPSETQGTWKVEAETSIEKRGVLVLALLCDRRDEPQPRRHMVRFLDVSGGPL